MESRYEFGRWASWAAFLIPTFIWLEVVVVGRIFVPELLLLALLPFLLAKRGRMLAEPLPRTFLLLAVLWLMAQILTDVIRESDFHDYSRGWAKITLTTLNFCTLYLLLYGSRRRLVLFALGLAVGGYLSFLLNPSLFAEEYPWKFALGPSTAFVAVLMALWIPFLRPLPIFVVGVYSMMVGARALAGVLLLTALYVLVQQIVGRRAELRADVLLVWPSLFLVAGIAASAMVVELYGYMAVRGYMDQGAQWVYERQHSGALGVLLGGRSEILASARAVLDSPLIGHGSWAKNPEYVAYILDLRHFGYDVHYLSRVDAELIPSHSHLMGAWVEAGILGAAFWGWVLLLVFRVLSNQYMIREPIGPLIAFVGFLLVWDIFFSPFGAERRYIVPFYLVLMMFAWDTLRARMSRSVGGHRGVYRSPRAADESAIPRQARLTGPGVESMSGGDHAHVFISDPVLTASPVESGPATTRQPPARTSNSMEPTSLRVAPNRSVSEPGSP